MGCDIHAILEAPHHYSGCGWVSLGDIRIERHYEAFAALAGVRAYGRDVKPISVDRLLDADFDRSSYEDPAEYPVSAHAMQMFTELGVDGHSHGYATLEEMKTRAVLQELTERCFNIALAHGKNPSQCRLVFCFDN